MFGIIRWYYRFRLSAAEANLLATKAKIEQLEIYGDSVWGGDTDVRKARLEFSELVHKAAYYRARLYGSTPLSRIVKEKQPNEESFPYRSFEELSGEIDNLEDRIMAQIEEAHPGGTGKGNDYSN